MIVQFQPHIPDIPIFAESETGDTDIRHLIKELNFGMLSIIRFLMGLIELYSYICIYRLIFFFTC